MLAAKRSSVLGYTVAVLTAGAALLLRLLLDSRLDVELAFPVLLLGSLWSAWYGGLESGLLATAVGFPIIAGVGIAPAVGVSTALTRAGLSVLCAAVGSGGRLALHRYRRPLPSRRRARPAPIIDVPTGADGRIALGPAEQIVSVSAEAEQLLERPGAALVGRALGDALPSLVPRELLAALGERRALVVEACDPHTERWLELRAYPVDGGAVIYLRDISRRKQATAELERLKQYQELILNSVGEGIIGLDARGAITFVNPAAAALLGYDGPELIGQSQHALMHHTRPNGTPHPLEQCPIEVCVRRGTTQHVDADVFWTKNGTGVPVAYLSTPLRENDAIVGAVVTFRDIAERKLQDARRALQYSVTQVMAQAETLQAAIPGLLQAICVRLSWDLGELWLVDERQRLVHGGGWYALTVHAVDFEIGSRTMSFAAGEDLPGRVWATGEPVWLTNAIADPLFGRAELAADRGLYTAFAVPVRNGRDVVGVLVCFSRAMQPRDDDLLRLMTDIGSQIGQYLERRQAEARVERSAVRLATLHRIDRAILAASSPAEIAMAALRHLWQFVPYQQASVDVLESGGDTTRLATFRPPREELPALPAPGSPDGAAAVTEATELHVPLIAHDVPIGALVMHSSAGQHFSDEQRAVLSEVGAQLALSIQQARLFAQVRSGNDRLQALSARLVDLQELERRHIARELHDEIGQALTAAQLNLQDVASLRNVAELPDRIEDSLALIETVLQQVRTLSLDLRPSMLDDLGLVPAIRWYARRQAGRAGFAVQLTAEPLAPRPPTDIETACFRVTQEAITNIIRYARATAVEIDLRVVEAALQLEIRDNGIGFDVSTARERATRGGSLGILGMEERAVLVGGQCSIVSAPGKGTLIRAQFPLHAALEGMAA